MGGCEMSTQGSMRIYLSSLALCNGPSQPRLATASPCVFGFPFHPAAMSCFSYLHFSTFIVLILHLMHGSSSQTSWVASGFSKKNPS
ncbi:hypothetical protein LZ31DRAFT_320132 [Colletotrichum somersetense]|nr:hypothetical protein LZ31DRAFT_320132 [Colletotrichum somersetense]